MERGELVDALGRLSFQVQSALGAAAAGRGVSTSQLRLLGILRDREPEMLELARHLNLDKSSVSGLVARAESRGLVERIPLARDGRRVGVRLTASGRALAAELETDVETRLAPLIDAMTEGERSTLVAVAALRIPNLP